MHNNFQRDTSISENLTNFFKVTDTYKNILLINKQKQNNSMLVVSLQGKRRLQADSKAWANNVSITVSPCLPAYLPPCKVSSAAHQSSVGGSLGAHEHDCLHTHGATGKECDDKGCGARGEQKLNWGNLEKLCL